MAAKVLVIDDDEDVRASVKLLLETHGYEVVLAECGKEGLKKLAEHKPDLILLDIMMESDTEGYSLTHALKWQDAYAEFRGVPIIMMSSIEESPDERFPMSCEAELIRPDLYLAKPVDLNRLLEIVTRAVARRATAA
ncbi:MAG: PleD family two-component system response regulator [Bryobacteraceae bacterium]